MKKNDLYLLCSCILVLLISIAVSIFIKSDGDYVKVYVDKVQKYMYELDENVITQISGIDGYYLTMTVNDGAVFVTESNCPDKSCEKTGKISKANEAIICLPGRIVITIEADEKSEYDSISR